MLLLHVAIILYYFLQYYKIELETITWEIFSKSDIDLC